MNEDIIVTTVKHLLANEGLVVSSINVSDGKAVAYVKSEDEHIKVESPINIIQNGDELKFGIRKNEYGTNQRDIVITTRINNNGYSIHKIDSSDQKTVISQSDYNNNDIEICHSSYEKQGRYTSAQILPTADSLAQANINDSTVYVVNNLGVEKAPESMAESTKAEVKAYKNGRWSSEYICYIEPNHPLSQAAAKAKMDPEFQNEANKLEDVIITR